MKFEQLPSNSTTKENVNINEKYIEVENDIREKLKGVFDSENFIDRHNSLISLVESLSKSDLLLEEISNETFQSMKQGLEQIVNVESNDEYVEGVVSILQPLLRVKAEKPVLYEDVQALSQMEISGFTPLNKRVSCGYSKDHEGNRFAHIHFADSHELKKTYPTQEDWVQAMQELYEDGLTKIAKVATQDESFTHVSSTSWLNNTKTYGNQKKRMGFIDFKPISEELRRNHFANETRPVIGCTLPREVLLQKYYENK